MQQSPIDDPIAAVTHPDPYPYYKTLTEEAPFSWNERLSLWVASDARHVEAVFRHPAARVRPLDEPVPRSIAASAAGELFGLFARMNDGDRHAALRAAVDETIASLHETCPDFDTCDPHADANVFIEEFAVASLASMLGVDATAVRSIVALVRAYALSVAPGAANDAVRAGIEAARALRARLSPSAIALLFQSYDATRGLIGNTVVAIGRRPDVLRRVRAEPEYVFSIVEETERYDSPVQNTRRFLADDVTIEGRDLKTGDGILLLLAAANRDPAANPHPSRFDPDRPDRRSYSFGSGTHSCPGRALALGIAAAGVARLLACGIDIAALAREIAYRPSVNARIPIFSPARAY
jgi:cytochrome P450